MSAIQFLCQTRTVIGIIMLGTEFPRPKGDVGHPQTFGVPLQTQRTFNRPKKT